MFTVVLASPFFGRDFLDAYDEPQFGDGGGTIENDGDETWVNTDSRRKLVDSSVGPAFMPAKGSQPGPLPTDFVGPLPPGFAGPLPQDFVGPLPPGFAGSMSQVFAGVLPPVVPGMSSSEEANLAGGSSGEREEIDTRIMKGSSGSAEHFSEGSGSIEHSSEEGLASVEHLSEGDEIPVTISGRMAGGSGSGEGSQESGEWA